MNQYTLNNRKKIWLWVELILVFIGLPLAFFLYREWLASWVIPTLIVFGILCLSLLLADPKFKRFRLWNAQQFPLHHKQMLLLFFPGSLLLALSCWWLIPDSFFSLPMESPWVWLLLLLVYPLFSALPQELIFRTFLFHRYKKIIPKKKGRMFISSLSFSLAHLFLNNWIAVVMSFFGGLLFSMRYIQSRSTAVAAAEHSLWGLFLFTCGIGVYFDGAASIN